MKTNLLLIGVILVIAAGCTTKPKEKTVTLPMPQIEYAP